MDIDIKSIDELVDTQIAQLNDKFQKTTIDFGDYELFITGALKTGLYTGPKPSCLSHNPNCPYENVIEADLRLVLDEAIDPHDHQIVDLISSVFEPEFPPVITQTYHWDRTDIPTSRFYKYQPIEKKLGFEWELAVCRKPYVDVALFWKDLFTPDEIEWHRNLRSLIYNLPIELHESYVPFKNLQNTEARWRLVAGYALSYLSKMGAMDINCVSPTNDPPQPPVDFLMHKWLEGASGYRTMERPESFMPDSIRNLIEKVYPNIDLQKLIIPPDEPSWVSTAAHIQTQLKDSRKFDPDAHSPVFK